MFDILNAPNNEMVTKGAGDHFITLYFVCKRH